MVVARHRAMTAAEKVLLVPAYFAVRDALLERCRLRPQAGPFCSPPWPPGW